MSKIAWRWWDLGTQGQLLSFQGEIWGPGEPVQAECVYSNAYAEHVECEHPNAEQVGPTTWRCPTCKQAGLAPEKPEPWPIVTVRAWGTNGMVPWPRGTRWVGGNGGTIPHKVAMFECSCGIYCFKWAEDALALPKVGGYQTRCRVIGAIEIWGRLTETELGYRAEYAIPRALYSVRGRLNEVYRTCVDIDSLPKILERWDVNE